jgi:hypothetical protein
MIAPSAMIALVNLYLLVSSTGSLVVRYRRRQRHHGARPRTARKTGDIICVGRLQKGANMPGIGKWRRQSRTACWIPVVGLLFAYRATSALAMDATICRYVSPLPDDCGSAAARKYNNLRNYRYLEINLIAKDVLKSQLYESRYNTTGLNGGDDSRDSAPQSLVQPLSAKAIAKQYQALFVLISPTRYWAIDWLIDRVGNARHFGGLDAAWMGNRPAPYGVISAKPPSKAYRYMTVPRTSSEGFKKGSKVYLLDDVTNRTWVMRSYTDQGIKDLTMNKLDALGDRIALPSGWKFRTVVLGQDLILETKNGASAITEDDKENIYDLTGPGQSNFRP